jgi:hypothetical protein
VAETCTGTQAGCPADTFLPASTVCRPATGPCDVAETCTGSAAACPPDGVKAANVVCLPANGTLPCDVDDVCNGTTKDCPVRWAPPSTVCRAAAGPCDAVEYCTGSSGTCPTDAVLPNTTVCRARNPLKPCDVDDLCTGGVTCPVRAMDAGVVCRPAAGPCDVAEACNGISEDCPADAFKPSTTVCHAAVTEECDVAEYCTGSSAACPSNAVINTGQVCTLGPFSGGCTGPTSCRPGLTRECAGICTSNGTCAMCRCECN